MVLHNGIRKRMSVADGTVDIAVQGATSKVTLPMLSAKRVYLIETRC